MPRFTLNGTERTVDPLPGRTLLDVLRDDLRLTGAKYGCGEGECGACTVLVDGGTARACTMGVEAVDGCAVTTVEGLAGEGRLHAVQAAFVEARSLQCGYCTPGMVLAAAALLARDPAPDDAAIRAALAGNVCRCGGYPRILQAVHAAAAALRDGAEPTGNVPADPPETAAGGWTVVLPPMDGDRDWGRTTPGGARLLVDPAGLITAFTGKVDGGQGNRPMLTRLVAAELATATSQVRLEMGDTATAPLDRGTFGSRSTPDAGHGLRLVAAAARRALLREAARQWQADPADLRLADGAVHDKSGRDISYGALVSAGSRTIEVDPDEPLPPAPQGIADVDTTSIRRDLIAAVTGTKRFPSDLAVPDMVHGRVLRPPRYGAVLRSVDTTAARRMPDVTVVEDGDFVAVAAPSRTAATAAVRAFRAEWESTPQPAEADLQGYLRSHPAEGTVNHETGDVDSACAGADVCLAATYTTAYIAHVPMEPRAALARLDGDAATVWVGTQRPFGVRSAVADVLGLAEEQVRVVVPDFGGGFGGKQSPDVAVEAARLARATGRPVKVSWTREEEFCWAYLRPAAVIDVRSAAGADGNLLGWEFTNINSGAAGLRTPYDIPNQRVQFRPAVSPLPQGSYRGLAATANNFARESQMDELAAKLRVDAVEFRLRHLPDARLRAVLTAVADRIGWPGPGMGIACGLEKDSRVATAAEVAVDSGGALRVLRIVTAFDCGAVVDPSGLRNQIIGATIMGLGGALFEAIHFDSGRILNASLAGYRVPRFPDIPPIDVIVLDNPDVPSAGAGETPIITVAPALGNAIHAATGRRIRSLPLAPDNRVRANA